MIKAVTIINHMGDSIELELMRPEKSGFIVESIEGLGPVKATVNLTEIVTNDGAQYNSSRLSSRNIIIKLRFLFSEKETIEDIRQKSYRYFPLKKKVKVIVETDNRLCETEGIVESNEPNIFSKEEGTSISILCPNSYFYLSGENSVEKTEFAPSRELFIFPFSNDSLTEPLIEFAHLNAVNETTIEYKGDSEIGVDIDIVALGPASDILMINTSTSQKMKIDTNRLPGGGLLSGDVIHICTIRGKKSVTLTRNGKTVNALNCLAKNTDWFMLVKGNNVFSINAEQGLSNLRFEISNGLLYEGV